MEAALHCMLDLLTQINSAIQQLHIMGFAVGSVFRAFVDVSCYYFKCLLFQGDLRLMGPLRLQTECDVFAFSRKKVSFNN